MVEATDADEAEASTEDNNDNESRSADETRGETWFEFTGATRELVEDAVNPPGSVNAAVKEVLSEYETIVVFENEEQARALIEELEALPDHDDFHPNMESYRQDVIEMAESVAEHQAE